LLKIYPFVPSFIKVNVGSFEPFIYGCFRVAFISCVQTLFVQPDTPYIIDVLLLLVLNMKTQLDLFHQCTHALGSCNKIRLM